MNLRVLSYVLAVEEPLGRLDCRERWWTRKRERENKPFRSITSFIRVLGYWKSALQGAKTVARTHTGNGTYLALRRSVLKKLMMGLFSKQKTTKIRTLEPVGLWDFFVCSFWPEKISPVSKVNKRIAGRTLLCPSLLLFKKEIKWQTETNTDYISSLCLVWTTELNGFLFFSCLWQLTA